MDSSVALSNPQDSTWKMCFLSSDRQCVRNDGDGGKWAVEREEKGDIRKSREKGRCFA